MVKIPQNVLDYISRTSDVVGRYESERFNQDVWCFIHERGIESPIEQRLYIALRANQRILGIEPADPVTLSGEHYLHGLMIAPQEPIGQYRADFLITMCTIDHEDGKPAQKQNRLVVECDGHAWHERSEQERRYEKQRDRFMVEKGYDLFRYTGSEIFEDPNKIAIEILAKVTGNSPSDMDLIASYA